MNSNPSVRNPAHGVALEQYRVAEATLFRFTNVETGINGRGIDYLATMPEYVDLVQARDDARAAVEEANPAGTAKK